MTVYIDQSKKSTCYLEKIMCQEFIISYISSYSLN